MLRQISPDPEAPTDTGVTAETTVPPEPGEPIADAGPDAEYQPLQSVELDGSASSDPGGLDIVAWEWSVVAVPAGSTADLDDRSTKRPAFFADLAGDYVFELSVQNADGAWDSSPDEVVISTVPADGFYVELSWDDANDLDLHLLDGSTALFGEGDCSFCNLNPAWGGAGRTDDPSLDADSIFGFGPETITIDAPSAGTFSVQVHYYGEDGLASCVGPCASSEATVRVYLGGIKAAEYTQTMGAQGQVWDVVEIDWPSGQIHPIEGLGATDAISCF